MRPTEQGVGQEYGRKGTGDMLEPYTWNLAERSWKASAAQFAGRYADEATLYRIAGQLEEARPWKGKVPSIAL